MSDYQRQNFWFGLVFGEEQGTILWEAIERWQSRFASFVQGGGLLLGTPEITAVLGDTIGIGALLAWSNGFPIVKTDPDTIDFTTVTDGSVIGSSTPSPGNSRFVVILIRHLADGVDAITDANGQPGYDRTLNSYEFRVIMGNEFATAGASTGEPPDLADEIAAGGVPLVAVLKQNGAANTFLALHSHIKTLGAELETEKARGRLLPGCFVGDLDAPDDWEPPITVSGTTPNFKLRLGAGNGWVANVGGRFVSYLMRDLLATSDYLESGVPPVGISLLRLQIGDGVRFPERLRIYCQPIGTYPDADGESWDAALPTGLRGDETETAAFLSTPEDIVLAVVDFDGATSPTVVPVANPAEYSFETQVAADYAVSPTLDVTVTPPLLCGREWDVTCMFEEPDEGSAPVDRGSPHNLYCEVRYQNPEEIGLTLRGTWFDTSGASIAEAATNRFFRPPARLFIRAREARHT